MFRMLLGLAAALLAVSSPVQAQSIPCDPPPGGDFGFWSGTWKTSPGLQRYNFVRLPPRTDGTTTRRYRIQSNRDLVAFRHNLYTNFNTTTQFVSSLHDGGAALVEGFQIGLQRDPTDNPGLAYSEQTGCWQAIDQTDADLRYDTTVWSAFAAPGKPSLIALFATPRLMVVGIGSYLGKSQLAPDALTMRCPSGRVRVLVDGVEQGQAIAGDPAGRLIVGDSLVVFGQRVEIEWNLVGSCAGPVDRPDGLGTLKVLR